MTAACRQVQGFISLRVAGGLDAEEGARLDAHLAGCTACRAELERTAELLDLVRLPPPTPTERHALGELPARIAAELRAGPAPASRVVASLRSGRGIALGALVAVVAAGIAAAAIAPAVIRREPPAAAPAPEVTVAAPEAIATAPGSDHPAWQEPDLDALWQDASVVTFDTSDGS